MDIERELEKYKTGEALVVLKKKRNKRGSSVNLYVPAPEYDVVKRMLIKFDDCIKKTGYDASFIEFIKRYVHGYEHFIRIRLGTYTYYLCEFGLDQLINGMNRGLNYRQLRTIAEQYGIRATKEYRDGMQKCILKASGYKEDYEKLLDLSYYELHERFKRIPMMPFLI